MGCVSALLGFLALLAVVVFWPTSDPSYLERWLPLTILFTVCASVVALVLAFTVLSRRYPGRLYAGAAILLAIGTMLLTVGNLLDRNARSRPHRFTSCVINLKQLALAHQMYAEDWNGRLPRAGDWVGALAPYVEHNTHLFVCPADERHQRQTSGGFETSYTMNELCGGRDIAAFDAPGETVLMFDGTALCGGHDDAAFRHTDVLNVSFVDGHCKMLVDKSSFEQLRWEP